MSQRETFCSFCLRDADPEQTFSVSEGEGVISISYDCVLAFADAVQSEQADKNNPRKPPVIGTPALLN